MPFFFFSTCVFFWGVWVEVSYFFCLDGGFKVGNTHHFFIHLEEFHSLPVFFLRCFGSNLAQFDENFGGCNFRGPWEFTQKMGGCWCFRVFPKSEWFMGCCTPLNEALCSCKNTETLDFWFGHKFYSLRGADCWTSWNWSTFAGRAFCGILPGAKVWVGCEGVDLEHRGRRNPRGDWLLWFFGDSCKHRKNGMLDF